MWCGGVGGLSGVEWGEMGGDEVGWCGGVEWKRPGMVG